MISIREKVLKNYKEKKKKFASVVSSISSKDKKEKNINNVNNEDVAKQIIENEKKSKKEKEDDEFISFLKKEASKAVNQHHLLKIHTGTFVVFMEKEGKRYSSKIEAPLFIKIEDLEEFFDGFKIIKFREVSE